jgi:hypothetical protein
MDSGWVEVSDFVTSDKISHAFRDRRKAVNWVQARTLKANVAFSRLLKLHIYFNRTA